MFKQLLGVFCGVCLGLIGHCTSRLYLHQEQLLFKYRPLKENHSFAPHYPFEEVFLKSEDLSPLHALLYKTQNPQGLVVYFHGRGSNLSGDWRTVLTEFVERSHDVLIMDYRGFGKSQGKLSEKALLSDALVMYDYGARRYGKENIVVYGRSLGTGIATYVASQRSTRLLILEAPYFSMRDLIAQKFPIVPELFLPIFFKYPLRTDKWIRNVSSTIEIFHGTSDTVIPYKNSQLLYELILQEHPCVHLTSILGGTHLNLAHHPEYQHRLDLLFGKIKKN